MRDELGIFRVETTFPPGCDVNNPVVQDSIGRINRMVFLLEGVNFETVYTTEFEKLAQGMVARLDEAVQKGLISPENHAQVMDSREKLFALLAGTGLTMKDMLTRDNSTLPEGLLDVLRKIHDAGVCIPVAYQDPEAKAGAARVFESGFLNGHTAPHNPGVGDLTDFDLYRIPAQDRPRVHQVVQQAKSVGVLDIKPNNMACKWPDCVPYTGLFCSTVDGKCTMDSDPHP